MTNKPRSTEEDGYNIHIYGRHVEVTDAMKQYAEAKLSKLERFHAHIMDVHVTMDIQKKDHLVDVIVKFDHLKIKAHAVSTDMYASIDQAMDRLQKQLRRWKEKIQDHSSKKLSSVDIQVNVVQRPFNEIDEINQEIESKAREEFEKEMMPGQVLGKKTISLKNLLSDEAIMKMELSGDSFLLYRSEEDRKIKVMYRRKDGNYGIIHAE